MEKYESYEWVKIPTDLNRNNLVMVIAKTTKTTLHPEDMHYPVRIFKPEELKEAARSLAQRPVGINHLAVIPGAFAVDSNWNIKSECIEALLYIPSPFIDKIKIGEITKVSVQYTWRDEKRTENGIEFSGLVFNRIDLLSGLNPGDSSTQINLVEGKRGLMEGIIELEESEPMSEEDVIKAIKEHRKMQEDISAKLYPKSDLSDGEKQKLHDESEAIEAEIKGYILKLGQMVIDKEEQPIAKESVPEIDITLSPFKELNEAADEAMKTLGEPFAQFKDWAACIRWAKAHKKSNPDAYCGYVKHKAEPKKEGILTESAVDNPTANPTVVPDNASNPAPVEPSNDAKVVTPEPTNPAPIVAPIPEPTLAVVPVVAPAVNATASNPAPVVPVTPSVEPPKLDAKDVKIVELEGAVSKLQESMKTADADKAKAVKIAEEKVRKELLEKVESALPDGKIISTMNRGGQRLAEDIRRVLYKERKG